MVCAVCIAILPVLIVGCSLMSAPKPAQPAPKPAEPGPKPAEGPQPAAYFPVAVGSRWDYAGIGNEYAAFVRTVTFRQGDKAQVQDDNGGTVVASVFRISANEIKRIVSLPEFYENRSLLDAKENASEVLLRAPLKAGEKWDFALGTRTIDALGVEVTVPAGTFKQVLKMKVTSKGSDWVTYEYYAPGVGLVKKESGDGKYTVSSLLKSWVMGK
jgi:hypothetical protein